MASDSPDSHRRKHRRSPSDDEETEKSSKRHKHRHHKHRHHRHRSKKHEDEAKDGSENLLPPPPSVPRPDDDVEEGEILDEEQTAEIKAVESRPGLGASNPVVGESSDSLDEHARKGGDNSGERNQNHVPLSRNLSVDSQGELASRVVPDDHINGDLPSKYHVADGRKHQQSRSPSRNFKKKTYHEDVEEANDSKVSDKRKALSSESSGEKYKTSASSPFESRYHDYSRNRSETVDRARERSRSQSIVDEEALLKRSHHHERDRSRDGRHGSRILVRGDDREGSVSYGRHVSEERHQNQSRPNDRGDRKKEKTEEWNQPRENERSDRSRDIEIENDGYGDRDRYRNYKHSKRDDTESYRDRTRKKEAVKLHGSNSDSLGGDGDKLKRDEEEQDNEDSIVLKLDEPEEDEINRIKEESRKRREAILEKYKSQQAQEQSQSHPEDMNKGFLFLCFQFLIFYACLQVLITVLCKPDNMDVENRGQAVPAANAGPNDGGNEDVYVAEPLMSVRKSPSENGHAAERTSGAAGLGQGTPKLLRCIILIYLFLQSERSEDNFCDDIFGETPTGVRKLGKGDGLPVIRSGLHDNWDDAEGYYSYRFGELLDSRYEVTAAHGKGVFSTVVRAKDLKAGINDPEEVAIKIIRNNETMHKAGQLEVQILKKLAGADPDDKRHCVRFLSSFKYRNHLCLVFESLHMNLREVLKKFGRNIGLKLTAVRAYAKQLFIALKHLKNCGVLHCDIKPDNMLVNEAKNVLKLCDFGNAMFAGKNEITPYLVSRFYRAPEIILGLPYDHPMDIWSVGCCLYELYTGKVLFPGPSNNDMLRLHMELKGPFPKKMLRKGAFIEQHFDQDLNFLATEEDPVTKKAIKRMILNIKPKDISSIIVGYPGEDPKMIANFKDLLEKIFVLDPEKRMTVAQALAHPFITGK
ncbi:hypothetical protein COLO4_07904 [Corchorus olitorius]|uniref:Serine/threonine-protein kinase PRP4 homolog n=1 Tax=Corchorus olitorius TaxID=93759 RepID=A0A1R3KI83_9ROSI|nr:hypothetical protein COLO4_07904 [Corchorus olitorius]